MDADDLVITLKKSLAKLSRTERRKAVELVGDVVRAAMFDDAAGDGYEVERCPAAARSLSSREGQVRERRAALPLPRLRQDVLRLHRPDPRHEQAAPRDLDGLCRVLRPHAPAPRVCRPLRRLPQDRLHHAPQAHRVPKGIFARVLRRAGAGLRARRDVLPESFKGNHSRGSFTLPRKPATAASRSAGAASPASRSAS